MVEGGLAYDNLAHHRKSPHSQSRVTAASTSACLACYGYVKRYTRIDKLSLRQYRACVVDSLELGITCLISLNYVYKVQGILILSLLIFRPSHSNLEIHL